MRNRISVAGRFGFANAALWILVLGYDGLVLALVSFVFATLLMYWLIGRRVRLAVRMRARFEPEGIVKDAFASLSELWTHTEGWLFLTKQRLVFEPFEPAHAKLGFDAPLAAIEPSLIRIRFGRERLAVSGNGSSRKFAVAEPGDWFVEVKKAAVTARDSTDRRTAS